MRLVEEIDQRLGDDRSDALDRDTRPSVRPVATRRSSSIVPKHLSRSLAVTMPIWRMPSPNRKRGPSGSRFASIAASRLSTDFSFQPSRPSKLVADAVQTEDVGGRMQPAQLDEFRDRLLAQPLDVERPRDTKCRRRSKRWAGQISPPVQRTSTSPFLSDRFALAFGAMVGEDVGLAASSRVRFSTTCGMTSPARWMRTRSPIAQAQPLDLVAIVERDVGDDHPADADRRQPPDRASACRSARPGCRSLRASSPPSPPGTCAQGPSAARGDEAEPLLQVEPVDLVDHAVDVERQVGARFSIAR